MLKHCRKSCKVCKGTDNIQCGYRKPCVDLHCQDELTCKKARNCKWDTWDGCTDVQCEDSWNKLDKGNCPEWSRNGECQKNPDFMLKHCRKSCKVCKGTDVHCEDNNTNCPEWATSGECDKNPYFRLVTCRKSCKICTDSSCIRKCEQNAVHPQVLLHCVQTCPSSNKRVI